MQLEESTLILQADHYLGMVRRLPRPSVEQTYRFAWFVAEAHSWYKHLPPDNKVPFFFYLDPYAGMNLVVTPTQELAIVEITDQSTRFHYTWQTTADYRRRFGHWNYSAPYGTSFMFGSDGGMVNTAGVGTAVLDEQGNWVAVPPPLLEAGKAEVNAFVHPAMVRWWPRVADAAGPLWVVFADTAAKLFRQLCECARPLSPTARQFLDQRLSAATNDPEWSSEHSWFGSSWFDEEWKETLQSQGVGEVELVVALSSFQRRLLLAGAQRGRRNGEEVPFPAAFACERNRQLDDLRNAMLRVRRVIFDK